MNLTPNDLNPHGAAARLHIAAELEHLGAAAIDLGYAFPWNALKPLIGEMRDDGERIHEHVRKVNDARNVDF